MIVLNPKRNYKQSFHSPSFHSWCGRIESLLVENSTCTSQIHHLLFHLLRVSKPLEAEAALPRHAFSVLFGSQKNLCVIFLGLPKYICVINNQTTVEVHQSAQSGSSQIWVQFHPKQSMVQFHPLPLRHAAKTL